VIGHGILAEFDKRAHHTVGAFVSGHYRTHSRDDSFPM
jgi:hypothetical protein